MFDILLFISQLSDYITAGILTIILLIPYFIAWLASLIGLFMFTLYDLFTANTYMATITTILLLGINAKLTITLYNIIASTNILGFKLPKIPL